MAHQWTRGGFWQPPPPTPPTPLPTNSSPSGMNPWAYATQAPQSQATLDWTGRAYWWNPWTVDQGAASRGAVNSAQFADHTNVSQYEVWQQHYYQSVTPSEILAAAVWDGPAYTPFPAVHHEDQHGLTPSLSLPEDLSWTENSASSSTSSTLPLPSQGVPLRRKDRHWCHQCQIKPEGYRTRYELDRHRSVYHPTAPRKVWVCKDVSEGGRFLSGCKRCRDGQTYNTNYNAAAHLRRVHFNPKETSQGPRGGHGGGRDPPMRYLRFWIEEVYEPELQSGRAGIRRRR